MKETRFAYKEEIMQQLFVYLSKRPYEEVVGLITAIQTQATKVEVDKEEQDT
jgi:hypothetical protein